MSGRFEGQVALVTGSSRGIGRAIVLRFAREGADVVVNFNRSQKGAAEVVREAQALGRRAIGVRANVADCGAVRAMVERAQQEFGHVDILVNCAGVMSSLREVADATPEEWQTVFGVNFFGVLYTSQATIPIMRAQHRGIIINISSSLVERCPATGAPYTCSKAAVEALARVIAREEAREGIRINCVRPGLVRTEMAADYLREKGETGETAGEALVLGRIGEPEDIAHATAFLASDEATWITGQVFTVNGGGLLAA